MDKFDHIIIGTGQATGTLIGKLIPTGDSIAVIEGDKVGGSCVNYGCTPTKTMVAAARAFHFAERGDFFGFQSDNLTLNYKRVRERMNEIRNGSSEGLTGWMESAENVELIRGWGEFSGKHTIKIGDREISGDNIYINTGTRPSAPPIEGLDQVDWLDSARLLDLEELPGHLLIIGGGYIGIEFAQVYRRLGAQVTVIQRSDQIMPNEDEDVAEVIKKVLEKEGVNILCNAGAKKVTKESEEVGVTVEMAGESRTLSGSHLLIAAGRKPNVEKLNLGKAGIVTNSRGFIEVDDYCRTNVESVFAVGDVNGHGAFTHTSVNDGEIVLDHLFDGDRKISDRFPIYALFSDPPLGRVGMTEKEALKSGRKVLKGTKDMKTISRAKEMGETDGFIKILVDADSGLLLGASIFGVGGDEIINMLALLIQAKIPVDDFRKIVLVHPTVSELIPYVLDGLEEIDAETS